MKGRFSRWAPVVTAMIAIFAASSVPNLQRLPGDISDHTWHFIAYAGLAALFLRALSGATWSGSTPSTQARAWAFASVYGVTDEFHQQFVPGRTAAVDDLVADSLGAVCAVALIALAGVIRSRLARSRAV